MKYFRYIWASLTMFWCLTFHDVDVTLREDHVWCRDCGREWNAA
jgi:hypothetical protein